jgi:hypothetical protein
MPFNSVRNYLAEKAIRIKQEWKLFQSNSADHAKTLTDIQDTDTRRMYSQVYHDSKNESAALALNAEFSTIVEAIRLDYQSKDQPFQLHRLRPDTTPVPESRLPAPGITLLPLEYHTGHIIHANPLTSRPLAPDLDTDNLESYIPGDIDYGPTIDPLILTLVNRKYPEYLNHINKYCRPAGTTDATFRDFNKTQIPSAPLDPDRKEHVLSLVFKFLDATPYLPIHFVDTQFAKLPLVTGTGYHNRFSYKQKAHAKYSHPPEYSERPTSKGFFYNATYENARTLIHKIKESGVPFNLQFAPEDEDLSDSQILDYIHSLSDFFNDYPTLLFTRNHISDKDKTLKVRPVYAVDDLFLIIETMLTFPLLVQARKPSCCIMYGLETIRGSNHRLDFLAKSYSTFFSIDWSGYDQRLPRIITDLYFTDFLRRLIVISHGYQPTHEYDKYPDLTESSMYARMDNLLHFLHLWYNNMTFLSVDGYAYRRQHAGVPSGLYNTQYLDSFANLFLLIDAMIEFGFSNSEILELTLFVLGDDNTGFTNWSFQRLHSFVEFLESYCLERYNMVLSKTKSVLTTLRSKIETLGYRCNFGSPRRDIDKLVAQLCYPEHGIKYATMSARAIGLAYASSGQDATFHSFCHDIYHTFLPYHKIDERSKLNMLRFLSLGTDSLDSLPDEMFSRFPTIDEIRFRLSSYAGPLAFAPKWNYAHFINSPDIIPPSAKTMHDFETEHSLKVRISPTFANGSTLPI